MESPRDRVRRLAQEQGISFYRVERACGLANGFLTPGKAQSITYERAVRIAKFLNTSPEYILTGQKTKVIVSSNIEPLSQEEIEFIQLLSTVPQSTRKVALAAATAVLEALSDT